MKKQCRFLIALLLLSLAFLPSCKGARLRNDVSALALCEFAIARLDDGVEYLVADEEYLGDYFKIPESVLDYSIHFAADGNNLNEFGIFHIQKGHADEMEELLEDYLEDSWERNQSWYDSYIPKETPKLRDAEVKVYGNYVMYAILDKDARKIFFDAVKEALKEPKG